MQPLQSQSAYPICWCQDWVSVSLMTLIGCKWRHAQFVQISPHPQARERMEQVELCVVMLSMPKSMAHCHSVWLQWEENAAGGQIISWGDSHSSKVVWPERHLQVGVMKLHRPDFRPTTA